MGEKRCYSVGEIQHILGICKTTAYNLIKENQFRAILIGGKYVISKKSFDEWLDGEITKSGQEKTQEDQALEEKPVGRQLQRAKEIRIMKWIAPLMPVSILIFLYRMFFA